MPSQYSSERIQAISIELKHIKKLIKYQRSFSSAPENYKPRLFGKIEYLQEKVGIKDHDKLLARRDKLERNLDILIKKQTADGFWKMEHKYPAKVFFEIEKVGQPSRWNTLRALRILNWWKEGY